MSLPERSVACFAHSTGCPIYFCKYDLFTKLGTKPDKLRCIYTGHVRALPFFCDSACTPTFHCFTLLSGSFSYYPSIIFNRWHGLWSCASERCSSFGKPALPLQHAAPWSASGADVECHGPTASVVGPGPSRKRAACSVGSTGVNLTDSPPRFFEY